MTFDLICAGLFLLFAILGLIRGLVRQVFGVLGFLGGLILARLFAAQAATELGPSLGLPPALGTIAFSIAIFIAVEVLAKLLGNFLHGHLGTFTGAVDKLGGLAIGGLKGVLAAWALASLGSLLHHNLPQAEQKVPVLAKLDLKHSRAAALALDKSFLGDVQGELKRAAAKARGK